ncbi:hypothetical protein U9M48_007762 [Paspalum notatum var. saurae]|uniref:F-box domain-containing protein n=1 Tax=Paspalum notatum var. saurae TaxID=547442 RepID=A0AAQ3SNM6_PASNO
MAHPRTMEESGEGCGCPLPEDLVVEVLRRLPYRSLCCARCVCKSWRDLSYHPDHRWRLAQDLSGLLYTNHAPSRRAHGGSGSFFRFAPAGSSPFPGLGFLPCGARARPLDCCNGLLLCRGGGGADRCYYVCNPAIGRFTALPKPASGFQALALAAVEPHGALPRFHVLNFARPEPVPRGLLVEDESWVQGLEVFSSQTGKWARSHACSESRFRLVEGMGSVFVNGFVNLLTHEKKVLAVDPEGRACRLIFLPVATWFRFGCLGQSQGFLQYAVQENRVFAMMEVWTLTDFEEGDWVLKHRFDIEVAPPKDIMSDYAGFNRRSGVFYVVVFHPEKDLVFLPVEGYKLFSYNLITGEVKEICMLDPKRRPRFLVYVPSYVNFLNL